MINCGYHKIIYKIEDFFKKLRYKNRHTNTIRIQLKKDVETLSDITKDFHLTYV